MKSLFPLKNWVITPLVVVALVTGCAQQPQRAPAPETDITEAPAISPEDSLEQAHKWLLQARLSPFPENARLILLAAETYLTNGNTAFARQAFNQLPATTLPGELQYQALLTEATLLLDEGQANQARERLGSLAVELPLTAQIRYHQLRAETYARTGHHLEAARERIWLEGLMSDPEALAENQRAIWTALSRLSSTALIQLQLQPPPDVLSGWMELVLVTRTNSDDSEALHTVLSEWRNRYLGHPADFAVLQDFFDQTLQVTPHPEHIAVLLPLSGNYRTVGESVRNGMLAAYYGQANPATELRFYDTAADPNRIWSIYQDAIAAGAQAVIGPLTKPEVHELARAGSLMIPVLALNRADGITTFPEGFFQFALAPEDEARKIAEEIISRGQRRALVLAPNNAWGDRLLVHFQMHWESLGGTLLEAQRYTQSTRERSQQVKALMNIDLSEARQNRLTRLLGQRSEYEPRRRQDADVVVLFAHPEDARLMRPLIRFHLASDLPVYATSHAYQGSFNINDKDMNGLMFCDMPWLLDNDSRAERLKNQLSTVFPSQTSNLTRMHAFGIDAFDILPYLAELQNGQRQVFAGVTGLLSLADTNVIERNLVCARFSKGRPRLLQPVILEQKVPFIHQRLKEEQNVQHTPLSTPQAGPAS